MNDYDILSLSRAIDGVRRTIGCLVLAQAGTGLALVGVIIWLIRLTGAG